MKRLNRVINCILSKRGDLTRKLTDAERGQLGNKSMLFGEDGEDYDWSDGTCAEGHELADAPPADDDEAWEAMAAEHADGCEWVETRAHRPEEYAYHAGELFAGTQDDPGVYDDDEDLPEMDYIDMRERFGQVTREMEQSYRYGYNACSRRMSQ